MAKKTYVPQANTESDALYKYLTRYNVQLTAGKTSDQLTALAALVSCLADFIKKWPKPPINP